MSVIAGLLLVIRQSRAGLLPSKHRIGLQRRCVCAGVEENKIKDSYAYQADYMPQRIEFMQWYSDYLRERYNQALRMIQESKDGLKIPYARE